MVKKSANRKLHAGKESILEKKREFKGVRMRKWGKWVSEVRIPHSRARIWLGSYGTPQEAARAYDCAVYCLRGPDAQFNFADFLPDIPLVSSLTPKKIQAAAARFAAEDFQRPSENSATVSWSECQSCIDGLQIPEEQDSSLLDSLLQDLESIEELDFSSFEEHRGFLVQQTKKW